MKRARILLVDDHTIVAEALQSLLSGMFDVVGRVRDGRAMIESARQLQPDIIITDISMPLLNGLDAAHQLKKEGIKSKIIFLTIHADPHLASEAFRLGAAGYLLKQSPGEELFLAIQEVLVGRIYLTPLITKDLLTVLMESKDQVKPSSDLSLRKREILQLIAEGRTMKEIACILKISTRTVETHKYDMMREISVKTTAELIQFAVKLGLVSVEPMAYPPANEENHRDTENTKRE
jgi:DNA-binding NarL/FixJ family response regulator